MKRPWAKNKLMFRHKKKRWHASKHNSSSIVQLITPPHRATHVSTRPRSLPTRFIVVNLCTIADMGAPAECFCKNLIRMINEQLICCIVLEQFVNSVHHELGLIKIRQAFPPCFIQRGVIVRHDLVPFLFNPICLTRSVRSLI